MPVAVKDALRQVAEMEGNLSVLAAAEYVQRLERAGRLVEECWS